MPYNERQKGRPNPPRILSAFDRIRAPGLYFERRTGTLYRAPAEAFVPKADAGIAAAPGKTEDVTQLSSDPFLTLSEARKLLADLGIDF